jgi:hypothetical protein
MEEKNELDGRHIVDMWTLGSWYDGNCVIVKDQLDQCYRLPVREILKMIPEYNFNVIMKRTHKHIHIKERRIK